MAPLPYRRWYSITVPVFNNSVPIPTSYVYQFH
jgi:hypothetical protein